MFGKANMNKPGQSLDRIIERIDQLKQISKNDLEHGDFIFVKTRNSVYYIRKAEENLYEVSGGWFDRNGISPHRLTIRGCTWGGSIINIRIAAACGLCLEFGNNLVTSPVNKIILFKSNKLN
jgi:hypothetical protein